jgi:hypothetical protein
MDCETLPRTRVGPWHGVQAAPQVARQLEVLEGPGLPTRHARHTAPRAASTFTRARSRFPLVSALAAGCWMATRGPAGALRRLQITATAAATTTHTAPLTAATATLPINHKTETPNSGRCRCRAAITNTATQGSPPKPDQARQCGGGGGGRRGVQSFAPQLIRGGSGVGAGHGP